MSNKENFGTKKKRIFLENLSISCNVSKSAEHSDVSPDTVYRHRRMDAEFRAEWDEAIELAFDELMLEMLRRARFGTEKAIVYGGKNTGEFKDLNDGMAMRLLSMHMDSVAKRKSDVTTTKDENKMDKKDDAYLQLTQKLADIKKRLSNAKEVKHIDPMDKTIAE